MSREQPRTAYWTFFLRLALSLGALVCGLILAFHVQARLWGPDADKYLSIASEIRALSSLFQPDLSDDRYWAIGYPVFLAAIQSPLERHLAAVLGVQILMVISMAWMVHFILRPISEYVAMAGFVAVLLSPTLVFGALTIGHELLFGWLVSASVTLLWSQRCRYAVTRLQVALSGSTAGVLMGLAVVTQSKAAALAVLTIALCILLTRSWKVISVGTFALGVLVVMAGLTFRNGVAFGEWNPITTNGPINIWLGNNPDSTGAYTWVAPPVGWDENLPELILNFARTSPDEFIILQLTKVRELWLPMPTNEILYGNSGLGILRAFEWAWVIWLAVAFVLFIAGALLRVHSRIMLLSPIAATVILGLLINVPFIAERRMRIPFESLIIAISVAATWLLLRRWTTARSTH